MRVGRVRASGRTDGGDEDGFVGRHEWVLLQGKEWKGSFYPLQLPPNLKVDVERLRHTTWCDEEVYEVLRRAGAALVASDTGQDEPPLVVATASYGYARLRKEAHEPGELAAWADVFVFFKHEDEGAGPALADLFVKELESEV